MNPRQALAAMTMILAACAAAAGGLPLDGVRNFDEVIALSEKEGKPIMVWIPG